MCKHCHPSLLATHPAPRVRNTPEAESPCSGLVAADPNTISALILVATQGVFVWGPPEGNARNPLRCCGVSHRRSWRFKSRLNKLFFDSCRACIDSFCKSASRGTHRLEKRSLAGKSQLAKQCVSRPAEYRSRPPANCRELLQDLWGCGLPWWCRKPGQLRDGKCQRSTNSPFHRP